MSHFHAHCPALSLQSISSGAWFTCLLDENLSSLSFFCHFICVAAAFESLFTESCYPFFNFLSCLTDSGLFACFDWQPMTNYELVYWLSNAENCLKPSAVSLSMFWIRYLLPAARTWITIDPPDPAEQWLRGSVPIAKMHLERNSSLELVALQLVP